MTISEIFATLTALWSHKLITIAGVKLSFGNILLGLVCLLFATRISKLITRAINKRIIEKYVEDKSSQNTYQTFAFYGSLGLVVALSLTLAGIPLTVFTVVGGALAIGVGFGSQNIVNNFISGIIILIEKPVKVGDIVEVDGIIGMVTMIGTRSTKIRNADNKVFVVPNSFFLEKGITNWTFETKVLRTTVSFGVAYGTNANLVENVCMDILLNTEGIEQTPMPFVLFEDFADSTLVFNLIFFSDISKIPSLPIIRSTVRFKINERFKEHGIQMAFPQRDLNFNNAKPLEVKVLS